MEREKSQNATADEILFFFFFSYFFPPSTLDKGASVVTITNCSSKL